MAEESAKQVGRPLRIGIFCENGYGAFPEDRGETFLNQLVQGLLNLDEPVEAVLFVRPECEGMTAALHYQHSSSRLRSVRLPGNSMLASPRKSIRHAVGLWWQAAWATKQNVERAIHQFRSWTSRKFRSLLARTRTRFRDSPVAAIPLLILGGCLGSGLLFIYWFLYVVKQFVMAGLRSLFFPWQVLNRFDRFRRLWQIDKGDLDPLTVAQETACDVWLVPSILFSHSLANLNVATVLILPESLPWQSRPSRSPAGVWEPEELSEPESGSEPEEGQRMALNRVAEATLCVRMTSSFPDRQVQSDLQVDPAKVREVPFGPSSPTSVDRAGRGDWARRWLAVFRDAITVWHWRSTFDRQPVERWPRLEAVPACPRDPLKVFLFLPQIYYGGVLQVTRELVSELAAINAERRLLHLTLGLLEGQKNTHFVKGLGESVSVQRMRLNPIRRDQLIGMCGGRPAWLADRPEQEFCFFGGAARAAFQADAWFSLIDRFPLPLLPARPLGILVQDILQRHIPEVFHAVFFQSMAAGIIPTARAAEVIVTGTPQTRDDVIAEYGLDPAKVRLIPVACNPHWHFGQISPRRVVNAQEPFILNVTNSSPHKGADIILRGYAQLKRRLASRGGPAHPRQRPEFQTPRLVLCGFGTQGFSQAYRGMDLPEWQAIRQLVPALGLVEGQDVVFLGTVSDKQLHDLYERCSVVVNAARYDNGCLCLAEGAYFGRPVISSRYSAAEFHAQRFGYRARFFPVGDVEALAEALHAALQEPPATAEDIARARARFLDPEFSFRRYAERFYDVLVQLAEKGRGQKLTPELRQSA